jgi:hypothetical protein
MEAMGRLEAMGEGVAQGCWCCSRAALLLLVQGIPHPPSNISVRNETSF